MKQKTNTSGFSIYLIINALLLITILTNRAILAGDNPKKEINLWNVKLSFTLLYDDNILRYSDKYINRFLNSEDKGRFHIYSYDDIVTQYSLGVSFSPRIIGNLKSIFTSKVNLKIYTNNPIKNWTQYYIGWQQYIAKPTSFLISYTYIPNYYVRHYRDDDWVNYVGYTFESFQPFSFTKDDFSIWAQHYFFKSTRARFYFSYMRYFHNEHYTEYDSKNFLYGIRVFQSLTKNIKVNVGYKYITSDAKGFDEPNETKELSDDADATYDEHLYIAGIEIKLPKIFDLKNNISITGHYYRRFYRTNHYLEVDPEHTGRYDYNYRVYFNYKLNLLSNLSLTVFLNLNNRASTTSAVENKEYLSDEKDYNEKPVGIKLNYKFQF